MSMITPEILVDRADAFAAHRDSERCAFRRLQLVKDAVGRALPSFARCKQCWQNRPMTPPAPNAPGNPSPARRPGCFWYFLSIPIFLVGVYSAIAIMSVVIFKDDSVDTDLVNVPGDKDIFLRKIGLYYVVSDKRQTVMNGDASSQGDPSDILVTVHSRASGQAVPLLRKAGTDDKTGRTMLTFNVEQMGRFQVTAAYRDGASGPAAWLEITSGFTADAIAKMITAGLMMFLGFVGPIVLIVYIRVKRRKTAPPRIPPPAQGGLASNARCGDVE